jgi:hypothetical protein
VCVRVGGLKLACGISAHGLAQLFANALCLFVIASKLNVTPIKKVITSICRPGRVWLCAHYA